MTTQLDKEKKKKLIKKLRSKYRLLIINEDTLEELFSLKLTPLNVFTWVGSIVVIGIIALVSLIAFTPLREFIPGYSDLTVKKQATYAALKADSLETQLAIKENYLKNIKAIINGDTIDIQESITDTTIDYSKIAYKPTKEDSILRKNVEEQDKYNLRFNEKESSKNVLNNYFFFTPLKGLVSSSFNPEIEHFGVDVIAPENEVIMAALDGTVTLANWTSTDGHIIQLQHENNIITMYKHNSVLFKKVGETVKAGETIAIIGESGKLTTGPHLHFELWHNGKPIDPQDYMIF